MTRTHVLIGIGAIAMASAAPDASAQIAKFEVLDQASYVSDLTPDGKWIVGASNSGGGFRWSRETGYELLGGQDATAISDDGTVVLGNIDDPEGIGSNVAGMWTEDEGVWFSLGALPQALGCPSRSDGYELSADGTIAVGLSWDACSGRGFKWTQATGMLELEPLADGGNRASVVSADGTLMGGFAQGSSNRTPAVWDGATLIGALLDPGVENVVGEVRGISDDGTILLGTWDGKGFKLVEGQPMELFSGPIGSWRPAAPMDIADDDTIIGFDFFSTSRQAWIRPNGGAPVNLRTYLLSLGLTDVPVLEVATRVSANGNIIIGHNFFANGWRVNLCVPDLSGNGAVDFADILAIIGAWGPCSGCDADLDGSGDIGFGDILVVIGAWGECP